MDRRVKERLIGASILVALVVLVVPELLSGPKPAAPPATLAAIAPESTRNVTLDLATSKAPATSEAENAASVAKGGTAASAPPAPVPSTVASSSSAPPRAASSSSAPPPTASPRAGSSNAAPPAAAAVETTAPSPISSHAAWAVQLGSFASRTNADNLSRRLRGQGFSVYVLPGGAGASLRYRVRVGPLADRESAERMAAKLKSIGHVSSLVAPAG
jgi:DedD protein